MESFNFDFSKVESENNFQPMPQGEYLVRVIEAVKTPTKAGNGAYIKFKYAIIEPEKYAKRFLWDNVTIENPNEKAKVIGLKRLKSMLEMQGFTVEQMNTKGPQDLVGKIFRILVKHESDLEGKIREKIAVFLKQLPNNKQIVPDFKNDEDAIPF